MLLLRLSAFLAIIFALFAVISDAWRNCYNTGVHGDHYWLRKNIDGICQRFVGWYEKGMHFRNTCQNTYFAGHEPGSYDFAIYNTDPNHDHYVDVPGCSEIFSKLDDACSQGGEWNLETLPFRFQIDPNHTNCSGGTFRAKETGVPAP